MSIPTGDLELPGGEPPSRPKSPYWTSTTKLVVGLTLVAIIASLFISFRNIIGPLIVAFILAYLLYPFATLMRKRLHFSWRLSVNLIYLVALIVILGLLTWGGIVLVDQITSLITFLDKQTANIPTLIENLNAHPLMLGPFRISPQNLDLENLWAQLSGTIQPIFARMGTILTSFASSAAITIGWTLFVLLISYFILSETDGTPERLIGLSIPGYEDDLKHMGAELGRIWNAFLRGQLIIILITLVVYTIVFGALSVRYFYGLALLAGMARFVPYVGPAIAWTAFGLVSYFQGHTIFGLSPFGYAIIVVAIAWVIDMVMDNFVAPRLLGDALKVHPAAVMVAAFVGASLFGVIGIVLAAPVLATSKLALQYVLHKLVDQYPWDKIHSVQPQPSIRQQLRVVRTALSRLFIRRWREKTEPNPETLINNKEKL